jgi:hypothetical protein
VAAVRKNRFGIGVLLLLLGGCNALRWRTADLKGDAEMAGYFSWSILLAAVGVWLMFRKTAPKP